MDVSTVLIAAACLAIPISVKYLLAFEIRRLLDTLESQEKEMKTLSWQLQALERERRVVSQALHQVENQRLRAQTRRHLVQDRLEQMRRKGEEKVLEMA